MVVGREGVRLMSVALNLDRQTVEALRRTAASDQRAALREHLLEQVVDPMLEAITKLINENPDAARQGLRLELTIQAERLEGEYLTTAEVARRFRVSQQQVRRWCESGRIQAERTPGGTWRIPAAQFQGKLTFVPFERKRKPKGWAGLAGAWKDYPELGRQIREDREE